MQATVLQFPQRNKGRVRKSQSLCSMGESALTFAAKYEAQLKPANVEVLNDHRDDRHDRGDLALMLAASIFVTLPPEQKSNLAEQFKMIGRHHHDGRARELLRILDI